MRSEPRPLHAPATAPRVLLAEDDAPFAEILAYRLEREGYDVVRASNGEAAAERVLEGGLSAVVASRHLPGGGVLELRERARASVDDPPRFLALVAPGRREDLLRCLEAGVADAVEKPVSPDEILVRLRRVEA